MKHQIKHINGSVLYEADIPDDTPSGLQTRAALERANLDGANLDGAYLVGAKLIGERPIFQIGPIGSRCAYLVAYITDAGIKIKAGCFFGTLAEFSDRVETEHGTNEHGQEYRAAIVLIEAHAKLWTPIAEKREAA